MTFTLQESAGGVSHRLMGWLRRLVGRPRDYYLKRLQIPASLADSIHVAQSCGKALFCPFCGYEVARLETSQGWMVETCSATAGSFLASSRLRIWLRALADTGRRAVAASPGVAESERLASHLPS